MRRLTALLALLCLVGPAGCGSLSTKAKITDCNKNSDCKTKGEICYADGCGPQVDFAVRVTPNDAKYVAQDFNPVSVAMSRMDLVLQDHGVVEGDVLVRTQGQPTPFLGGFTLEAVGTSTVIPGFDFIEPLSQSVAAGTSRFSLTVSPGLWSLRATPLAPAPMPSRETPSSPQIPPVFAQKAVGAGETLDPSFVFAGESLNEIQGNLVMKAGEPWPQATHWFMRFQALDPVTQAPLSQAAVFLATSTFHVFTAARGSPLLLRVGPDPKLNTDALGPTKDFRSDDTGAFASFEMGDFGSPVDVSVQVQDATGAPIANADLRADGHVAGGGTFSAIGSTDDAGGAVLRLLPSDPGDATTAGAKYTITVHPPFESSFASAIYSVVVGQAAQQVTVPCPTKVTLSGRVVGPLADGSGNGPLAGIPVLVEGNPAAPDPGRSLLRGLTTAIDGTFIAAVEPGSYRVSATPVGDRPLPWATVLVGNVEYRRTIIKANPLLRAPKSLEASGVAIRALLRALSPASTCC